MAPSIILVPGSFALPEFYKPIIDGVEARGLAIHVLALPSVAPKTGPVDPPTTMYDDAALIARQVEKLADEGEDVVVFAHSYGGVPAAQSLEGLSKNARAKSGKEGGVVRLAYISALVPPVGVAAMGALADVPEENKLELKMDDKGWMYHDPIERSAEICFSDISKERGEALMRLFPKHSSVSFMGELTYAGYNDVPVSYLLCEEDRCIPPKTQRDGIQMIEKLSGKTG